MKYPMIERLGLEINTNNQFVNYTQVVKASDLEQLLARAPVVNLVKMSEFVYEASALAEYTHNCLAVGIQPIRKDTAEQILKDFVSACEKIECKPNEYSRLDLSKLYDRARKLIEGEK